MKAVAFARVLGSAIASDKKRIKGTRDPKGNPILISTPPFDDEQITPVQAISHRAAVTHGYVPYEKHWNLLSVYQVTDKAMVRYPNLHERVFVFEYTPELERRRMLGIDEAALDPFAEGQNKSWYLQPMTIDRTPATETTPVTASAA